MEVVNELVSFLVVTLNRRDDLIECIASILEQEHPNKEIIVVDNGSDPPVQSHLGEAFGDNEALKVIRSEVNLGVSGGRNLGLKHVSGSVVITMDDDAVIRDPLFTSRIIERFDGDPSIGALALKITSFHTGEIEKGAFPWKDKRRPHHEEFETTWFQGGGHAIRKEVYDNVGLFQDYFPWGHEELDLSLRIVDAGYRIIFFPQAEVFHKKSPTSRISNPTWFHSVQLANRIKVAIRNLPWRFVLTTDFVRSTQVLISYTKFNLVAVIWAHVRVLAQMPRLLRERSVISKEAQKKIIALKGPVIF